ncbi:MAG: helix-turn-helix domain-containing protein [Chitinophagaceae bacterium]
MAQIEPLCRVPKPKSGTIWTKMPGTISPKWVAQFDPSYPDWPGVKFSVYLCEKLNNMFSYAYLSTLFSEVKGYTIQYYIILHKIERAKEMMVYNNELTLSEIAWHLHYNTIAHLSSQFKKITGLTLHTLKTYSTRDLRLLRICEF